jgi:excisionase family DNA binding protein
VNELPKRDNLFPAEVAKFLRISIRTVYDMIDEGQMPGAKIGRQIRIPRVKFLDWYEKKQANNNLPCD